MTGSIVLPLKIKAHALILLRRINIIGHRGGACAAM
jgi:hypothetical protein